MHKQDIKRYGGWFFPKGETLGVQKTPAHHFLNFVSKENKHGWEKYTLKIDETSFPLFHYPHWEDFKEGDENVVIDMVKELHTSMQGVKNPTIVINCRAGIGRTGTFATIFHFYFLLQNKEKELCIDDFSLEAIENQVLKYRLLRGDKQFVQQPEQFEMVCLAIQRLYNEGLSLDD